MQEFLKRVQADLDELQKAVTTERDAVVSRLRQAADEAMAQAGIPNNKAALEKFIETRVRQIEPAVENLYRQLRSTAQKHGFDLSGLENAVEKSARAVERSVKKVKAKPKAAKKTTKKVVKKAVKKKATAKVKKAPAKKKARR